jgi:hypothetical protein
MTKSEKAARRELKELKLLELSKKAADTKTK